MKAAKRQLAEWDKELNQLHERNGDLGLEVQNLKEELKTERADRKEVETQLSDLKQKSTPARDLPDAAEVYNQFKAKNPKTKFTYKDIVAIVATAQEILEESW